MAKTIWIVNYYTSPPAKASNPRYLKLAHYFKEAGYKVITFNHTFEGEDTYDLQQEWQQVFSSIELRQY